MSKPPRKEKGKLAEYKSFEELTKQLLRVPKQELDRKVRLYEQAKQKQKAAKDD